MTICALLAGGQSEGDAAAAAVLENNCYHHCTAITAVATNEEVSGRSSTSFPSLYFTLNLPSSNMHLTVLLLIIIIVDHVSNKHVLMTALSPPPPTTTTTLCALKRTF